MSNDKDYIEATSHGLPGEEGQRVVQDDSQQGVQGPPHDTTQHHGPSLAPPRLQVARRGAQGGFLSGRRAHAWMEARALVFGAILRISQDGTERFWVPNAEDPANGPMTELIEGQSGWALRSSIERASGLSRGATLAVLRRSFDRKYPVLRRGRAVLGDTDSWCYVYALSPRAYSWLATWSAAGGKRRPRRSRR